MKVIQVLPELQAGGVETGTLELNRFLAGSGHESIVISNGGRMVDTVTDDGGRHIALPVHRKSPWSLVQVPKMRAILESEKPDIVHARSRIPAWITWLAWRKMPVSSRPRFITTVHGFNSVSPYSKIMTYGQTVICVSDSVKEYILKNYPSVPDERIRVVHRGIDPAQFNQSFVPPTEWLEAWRNQYPQFEGKYLVTLPGRVTRLKGALDFVRVVDRLKRDGIPVHGILAGDTHPRKISYWNEVRQLMESLSLTDHVTHIGHRSDLREVLSVSGAVVSCSQKPESFGRTTLEAVSLGRPVAGYSHGGVQEQLARLLPDGLVPPGDHAALAGVLARWFENPPEIPQQDFYTLPNMLNGILSVYQNSLDSER